MARKASPRKRAKKLALGRAGGATSEGSSDRTPNQPGPRPRRDLLLAGLLLLLLFLVYNSNLRTIRWDDSFPARFLPFSLLLDHNLYLDHWVEPRLAETRGATGFYFVVKTRGHWMSAYPIITSVVLTPLYVLPAWWISRHSLRPYSVGFIMIANTMEKLSASLLAALSAAVLFLAFRNLASPGVSLAVALIYGLASNTWAISSQALWRHGLTELSFAFLLWALVRIPDSARAPFWAGLALAVAAANKPLEALLVAPFLLFFGLRQWKKLLLFLAPLVVLGALVFAYNLYFFGKLFGGYGVLPLEAGGDTHFPMLPRIAIAIAGSLLSPSRGLLVYMPWTAFAFWGAARLWKQNNPGWARALIVALAAIWLVQVGQKGWWGGWCFGPRYLTDLLPFLAWFLIPVWGGIRARPVLKVALVATLAFALWVQVVGAFYYPNGDWDGWPVNVEFQPQRCWELSDCQLLRTWRAGPAQPVLLNQWKRLLQPRSGAP